MSKLKFIPTPVEFLSEDRTLDAATQQVQDFLVITGRQQYRDFFDGKSVGPLATRMALKFAPTEETRNRLGSSANRMLKNVWREHVDIQRTFNLCGAAPNESEAIDALNVALKVVAHDFSILLVSIPDKRVEPRLPKFNLER